MSGEMVTVKLMPPYRKAGDSGEYTLAVPPEGMNLRRLAGHIDEQWKDRLAFPLVDGLGHLTAEFIVNGRHVPAETLLSDGDRITVIAYIGGG